ncbi:MAG: hypothetical protein HYT90_03870 [Candidatus Omnitrophica bacterium]|nr:hypothetical protein [Candidatus Omnitrophota bacterium]
MRSVLRTRIRWAAIMRGLLAGLLAGAIPAVLAEDVNITAYYPAPRGVYESLQTTHLVVGDGTETVGEVLVSDAGGQATWQVIPMPSGMIALFDGGCPRGWTRFGALDGVLPMGWPSAGATGGDTVHEHDITFLAAGFFHTHDHSHAPLSGQVSSGGWHEHTVNIDHDHDYSGTTTGLGCCMVQTDNTSHRNITDDNHQHDFSGTTATGGGDVTTAGPSAEHVHDYTLGIPNITEDAGGPAADWTVTTTTHDDFPPYRDMVFCAAP